ncbi:hypothetical protein JW926_04685, partial [Candidatus Sumerlaeota bacterium]|nr:hypothetical protein [Candidatus Sumerlaeota bacterium]
MCFRFVKDKIGKVKRIEQFSYGKLCAYTSLEYGDKFIVYRDYDSRGNRRSNSEGISTKRYEFGENGLLSSTSFFDDNEKPVLDYKGVSRYCYSYNDMGKIVEEIHMGVDDIPVRDIRGVCIQRFKYDAMGNIIEESYFDENDRPAQDSCNISTIISRYNETGKPVEERFYDYQREPVESNSSGVAAILNKYNNCGYWVEKRYFRKDGNLKNYGAAIIKRDLDEKGNILEIQHFDARGKLVETIEPGVAMVIKRYDSEDNCIEEQYFGNNGCPADIGSDHVSLIRYDWGKKTGDLKIIRMNKSGKIVTSP